MAFPATADGVFCLIVAKVCLFVARRDMQSDVLKDYYRPLLEQNHFISIPCPDKFSQAGQCWKIARKE